MNIACVEVIVRWLKQAVHCSKSNLLKRKKRDLAGRTFTHVGSRSENLQESLWKDYKKRLSMWHKLKVLIQNPFPQVTLLWVRNINFALEIINPRRCLRVWIHVCVFNQARFSPKNIMRMPRCLTYQITEYNRCSKIYLGKNCTLHKYSAILNWKNETNSTWVSINLFP